MDGTMQNASQAYTSGYSDGYNARHTELEAANDRGLEINRKLCQENELLRSRLSSLAQKSLALAFEYNDALEKINSQSIVIENLTECIIELND